MDIISFFEQALLIVAIIFAVVLIMSYIYSKFIKKEKEEEPACNPLPSNKSGQSKPETKRKTVNYTASADAQKLYVNTGEHRKHVVTNKAVSKPKRFEIINKTKNNE